jgi:predicted RNase H-like HicB family nuclease
MEKIIINVGASSDYFGAYAENCDGIYGAGETPEAAKQDALKGLELFVNSRDKKDLPQILQGEYSIVFRYDTQSLKKHPAQRKKSKTHCTT